MESIRPTGVRESGRTPELTRSGRDAEAAIKPLGPRAGLGRRSPPTHPSPKTCRLAAERAQRQRERLGLAELPTTTIGSFPQTAAIRDARRRHRAGALDDAGYQRFLEEQVADVIREQEALGLDVLVHREPERNDMVEYFGEQLAGFAFSEHGWVQSYGSRCVKPPILYGDVARPAPMTVGWWELAQGLTTRPVKGMLTGPVTILQWSFVRDDQPRRETCARRSHWRSATRSSTSRRPARRSSRSTRRRCARACRSVTASRTPIWAGRSTASGWPPRGRGRTQIHTHMCYSEFGEMIEHIIRLDADVLSIEASRSGMELLEFLRDVDYPGEIGPGIYDIHSPRVPPVEELSGTPGRSAGGAGDRVAPFHLSEAREVRVS